jgi:hypothetical protein
MTIMVNVKVKNYKYKISKKSKLIKKIANLKLFYVINVVLIKQKNLFVLVVNLLIIMIFKAKNVHVSIKKFYS